jgi:hypothetical protein
MVRTFYIEKDDRLMVFYLIALIAIVYAGVAGNLISFVLGIALFVLTAYVRYKWGFEANEEDEGYEEVKEEVESKTD